MQLAALCQYSVAAERAQEIGPSGDPQQVRYLLDVTAEAVALTVQFPDLTIPVVAAVLVGGTAIAGGAGSMVRTMLGTVFIALLQNVMLLSDLETGWRLLLEGSIVAVAVSLYALSRRDAR